VRWIWIPAVIVLESVSIAALAGMQRRLLAAGGATVGARPMLATTFAANALSVSVPLAGPELGTAFTFRRYTGLGADALVAAGRWGGVRRGGRPAHRRRRFVVR
jgi:putative heme transporter